MNQSVRHYWSTLGKMNINLNNEDYNSIGVKRSVDNIRSLDFNNIASGLDDIPNEMLKKWWHMS